MSALLITFVLAGLALAVFLLQEREPEPVTRSVSFAPDLTAAQMTQMLGTVASLRAGSAIRLAAIGEHGRIRFTLTASERSIAAISGALTGIAPGVRLSEGVSTSFEEVRFRRRLAWRGKHVLLRTHESDQAAAALLGVLANIEDGDVTELGVALRAVGAHRPALQNGKGQKPDSALQKKYSGHCMIAAVEVAASSPQALGRVTSQLSAALGARHGACGRLVSYSAGRLAQIARSVFPSFASSILTPEEIAGIVPWPVGGPAIPGVDYGLATRLLPPRVSAQSNDVRVFGSSTWPGKESELLTQTSEGATCHSILLGPSGSGKSWLLAGLFLGEIDRGNGALLLDMKGDTASDVIERIGPERIDDVVVLEPASGMAVPGLRSFGGDSELAADLWLQVFRGLYPDTFGIRSQRYIRMACRTLASSDSSATILDLPRVFEDAAYRRSLVSKLDDPLLAREWAAFEQLSEAQQSEHVASPLTKVSEVISRRSVRAVLGQAAPKMTVARALRQGKIVIVSLPPGVLGQPSAQLLGALVMFEAWQVIMSRQALPADQRPYFGLFVDEPAVLGNLPLPLDTLFETARGMGCGITLAAQSLSQLPKSVARAALTNAATIAAFRPPRADAKLLEGELAGLSADQLQMLPPFTVALRLGLAPGRISAVTTAKTLPLTSPTRLAGEARERSAQRYGTSADEVDGQLRGRLDPNAADGHAGEARAIGVARRQS